MKQITQMNDEELRKVFDINDRIRDEAQEMMIEIAEFKLDDYLHNIRGVDYCLEYSGHNHFVVTDARPFLDWLMDAQLAYELLYDYKDPEKYNELITRASELVYRRDDLECVLSDLNWNRLTKRINELITELEYATFKRLRAEYECCDEEDYLFDFFCNIYYDNFTEEEYFVDEDYNLYRKVTITECYNSKNKYA